MKLANGKLAGTLTNAEKDRPFEISLDVPVLTGGVDEELVDLKFD